MAEAFNGLRLLAGLPKANGLAPLADDLVAAPDSIVVVVATLKVKDLNHHVETDSTTAVTRFQQIEAIDGAARQTVLDILTKTREDRTGEKAMISPSGEIVVQESPAAERVTGGDSPDAAVEVPSSALGVAFTEKGDDGWEDPEPPLPVKDLAAEKAKRAARRPPKP
jgi:hypothetical protein